MKTINGILTWSWLLCALLMVILTNIYRPGSDWIFPAFLLHSAAFCVIYGIIALANRLGMQRQLVVYLFAFLFSYFILTLILWNINTYENEYLTFLLKMHSGKDFMILLFPYLISNILLMGFSAAVNRILEYDF